MTDLELLKEYGEGQSQEAFAELVGRHLEWVYGAAARRVHDRELAEDVAQGVFIALARRAKSLGAEQALSPWLLRVTRCAAISAMRAVSRRQHHEQKAAAMRPESITRDSEAQWEEVAPLLDDQVLHLGKKDQEAILLRFYERKSLAEVGEAMGLSEEAAKKRVQRAVGKLREKLAGKGVEVEAGSLGAMVLAHAAGGGGGMEGGAAGLVEKVMAGIGGGGGNGTAGLIAKGAEKMMVWAKVKVVAAVIVLMVAAGVGVGIAAGQSKARPAPAVAKAAKLPVEVSPQTRQLAAKIADEIEANMAKTTRIGYTFRIDYGLPEDTDIAGKKIGPPRQISATGEYSLDVASGRQYLLRITQADKPADRLETEIGGIPGRWTVWYSMDPGSAYRWAQVTSDPPADLRDEFRIGYCLIGTSSLPEVIRTAMDIEISKDTLDGDECYRIAMIAHQGVRTIRDEKAGVFMVDEPRCIWLSINHGLLPIRVDDYNIVPPPDQWNVATLVKPERLFSMSLQLDLKQMDNGTWLPSRSVNYMFHPGGIRWGTQINYDEVVVNNAVTVKTVAIPAAERKAVLKDMLRK